MPAHPDRVRRHYTDPVAESRRKIAEGLKCAHSQRFYKPRADEWECFECGDKISGAVIASYFTRPSQRTGEETV